SLVDTLTTTAAAKLFDVMARRNTLSRDHTAALMDVLRTYSELALLTDREQRRVRAYPLAMGTGKTQSVASWAAAVAALRLDHVSMLICGEQLRDLDGL